MDLTFSTTPLPELDVDLLAIIVDGEELPALASDLDAHLGGALTRELELGTTLSKGAGSVHVSGAGSGPARVVLVGTKAKDESREDALRAVGGKVASAARARKARTVAIAAPGGDEESTMLGAAVTGTVLGAYRMTHYRGEPTGTGAPEAEGDEDRYDGPESLEVVGAGDAGRAAAERAMTIAAATNWGRDLANAPANLMTPTDLAAHARELADAHEHLSYRELDRAGIEGEGMGLFAAVAQGAADEPRLMVLEWNPPGADEPDDERLAFVGKAVTFDTGGISIKPVGGMQDMKLDKSGGCAVLGSMRAIAELGVARRVVAYVGATKNMPDGNAYRPGDVITGMDGTTVEVISTDAEGRLVMADCITYARRNGCGAIVDVATLTGAMVIALGHRYTGACAAEGEELLADVLDAARETGDHAWPLPIHREHLGNLKTGCADLKNSGSRDAGGLSAGAFLRHFAGDVPFVHLDVAGSGMLPKPRTYFGQRGASGAATRLLVQLAESR